MTETWKPVLGFENEYSISNTGQVRSEDRMVPYLKGPNVGKMKRVYSRILSQHKDPAGYLRVTLARDGKLYSKLIHILLLESFVSPRPDGKWGLHWDDNELNNDLSNLRWGTPKENAEDSVRNGHNANTKKDACSKGHKYTKENTILQRDGKKRHCKACNRLNTRRYRQKLRKKAA